MKGMSVIVVGRVEDEADDFLEDHATDGTRHGADAGDGADALLGVTVSETRVKILAEKP